MDVTHNKETLCGLCDFIFIPDGVALVHRNNRIEQLFFSYADTPSGVLPIK